MGPSSPKEFDDYPYLVSLKLDQFIIGKPIMMNHSNLDHEPLIKNNVIISAEETMMQNPSSSSCSSSSSSPPIIHENPNTKSAADGVWNDGMKDPFGMRNFEEDFLQNPLMTKIDQEYMNWQQQEMMQIVRTDFKVLENGTEKSADNSRFECGKKIECVAKSVERRQRRMIKNRESAARSRARKQAYINQLQEKASQLQTSNKLLKKRKEAYAVCESSSISAPRYQLRRTSSAHF